MKRITRLAIVGLVLAAASIAAPQRGTFFVDMNDANVFSPQTIEVEPGSIIVWQNRGFRFHAVQSDDPSFGINSDWVFPLGYGYSYHFWWQVPYFAQSGTVIYYHCRFHGMPGNGLDYGREWSAGSSYSDTDVRCGQMGLAAPNATPLHARDPRRSPLPTLRSAPLPQAAAQV